MTAPSRRSFLALPLAASAAAALAQAPAERTLVVATGSTFRPFGFLTPDNRHVGFDVDVINAVAAAAGLKVKIVSAPFGALIPGLNNGDHDVAISAMTITPQRQEAVSFSNPYQLAQLVILTAADATGRELSDFRGRRVGVGLGQTADAIVSEAFGKTSPDIRRFENTPLLIEELLQGGIDAAVGDVSVMSFQMKANPGRRLRIVRDARFPQAWLGIAVRKGNDALLARINAGLERIVADGTHARIHRQWFDEPPPALPKSLPRP